MRFLGIDDFNVIDRMTFREYQLRIKAYRLKSLDNSYRMHEQAWLNNVVGQTDKKGRPVYKKFTKFFDYEKRLAEIEGKMIDDDEMAFKRKIADLNSRRGG